jgi:hypothetical protein
MSYSADAKNLMLDALGVVATKAALYTGAPGATGIYNEVSGGSYARQTVLWNAADSGNMNLDGTATFSVPAGTTVAYVGFWNTAGTTFYGSEAVVSETFTGAGTYTLTDADLSISD